MHNGHIISAALAESCEVQNDNIFLQYFCFRCEFKRVVLCGVACFFAPTAVVFLLGDVCSNGRIRYVVGS